MGLFDGFRSMLDPIPTPLVERTEEADAFTEQLYALIEERRRTFTLEQALRLPPIVRGVQLIAGLAASFLPLAYQAGVALAEQPRIVRKPDPFRTRYEFIYQTVRELVASRDGDAFWRLLDHDAAGRPQSAIVIPSAEVRVDWDARRIVPRYWWRDRPLVAGVEVAHIAVNRPPGELRGRGPISQALDYLYPVAAAEDYAASFFSTGGVPETVLKSAVKLSAGEAAALKAQYVESADSAAGRVRVASGGVDLAFPGVDPQRAQMQEARAYGATVAARVLGIPAALLHVETSGATITYQNASGALEELVKATVAPLYLAPVEQAWSELVGSAQAVRFDLADLQRTDMAARFRLYADAIGAGIITAPEARALEGWAPLGDIDTAHAFDPAGSPSPESAAVTPAEVVPV